MSDGTRIRPGRSDIAEERDNPTAPETAPREPCIPDFILRAEGAAARGARTVLVETMDYADETYRARKQMVHELTGHAARAPVVLHDFHFSDDRTQSARDRHFWLQARSTITGTDRAAVDPPEVQGREQQGAHP